MEHLSPAIALKPHCSGVTWDSTFQATKNRYLRIIIYFYSSKPLLFRDNNLNLIPKIKPIKPDERLKQTPSCNKTACAMQGWNAPSISFKMTAPQKLCSQLQTYKVHLFLGTNLIPVLWKILHWNGGERPGSVSRSPEVVPHLLPVLAGFNTQMVKPNFLCPDNSNFRSQASESSYGIQGSLCPLPKHTVLCFS